MDPKVVETAGLFGAFVVFSRVAVELIKFAWTRQQIAKTVNGHSSEFPIGHPEALRVKVQLEILDELRRQSTRLDSLGESLGAHDHRAIEFIGTANAALITQSAVLKTQAETTAQIAAVLPGIERAIRETR